MKSNELKFNSLDEFRQAPQLADCVMECIDEVLENGNFEEFVEKYDNFADYVIEEARVRYLVDEIAQRPSVQYDEKDVMQRYNEYFGDGEGLFPVEKNLSSVAINIEQNDKVIEIWEEIVDKMVQE